MGCCWPGLEVADKLRPGTHAVRRQPGSPARRRWRPSRRSRGRGWALKRAEQIGERFQAFFERLPPPGSRTCGPRAAWSASSLTIDGAGVKGCMADRHQLHPRNGPPGCCRR
ncbi:MAG: hypothetical protein U0797_06960 [Gemmataceae bacterium]